VDFDGFYAAEYPAAVRLAFVLTGRRDLAEEQAQEAFLAAHRRWDRIAGYDDPAGWVRRVVVNRSLSVLRRRTTEVRLAARLRRERLAEPALEPADEALWAAVRSLPRRQAEVLALAFVEDRSVADIAAVLGCGEATVRTHLRRGRLAVAANLGLDVKEEP
jgi:RNA polymerase sigma-70 factor (ECF subfamily)